MNDLKNIIHSNTYKFSIHERIISRLRSRRSAPILRVNTSSTIIPEAKTIKKKNSLDTLHENDNLEEESDDCIDSDSTKCNLKNSYNSVPNFSELSDEYVTLRGMQRETLSASSLDTLANNRRSFLLKFSERISTALENFESKMKNFDTGICADLEIDMNSMVKIVEDNSLPAIAKYIKEHDCKNIIVMSGAGISTNAEIPDFRSADRGVYANLEKYNIPYPEAIFELEYFKKNPTPFTIFAKEIYPKNIRPTIAHCFIKLLDNHNILLRHYTQNIDGLDYQTRLDSDLIVESHGSFHQSYCVGTSETSACGEVYPQSWYKEKLFKGENPIRCPKCQGYVKPGVIFFGENLPPLFFKSLHDDIPKCDLLLILGTSLKVYPFAEIIKSVSKKIPRCLINNTLPDIFENEIICDESNTEYIFSDNQYKRDVIYKGDCDKGCIELAKALGWEDELMKIYENEIEYANKYFN